jgi:protoheme ferro-lyase
MWIEKEGENKKVKGTENIFNNHKIKNSLVKEEAAYEGKRSKRTSNRLEQKIKFPQHMIMKTFNIKSGIVKWIEVENILSEVTQTQKDMNFMYSLIRY